jgi:hypothetical protein
VHRLLEVYRVQNLDLIRFVNDFAFFVADDLRNLVAVFVFQRLAVLAEFRPRFRCAAL